MKLLLTSISLCFSLAMLGQSFEILPSTDVHLEYSINDYTGDDITVKNISDSPISLDFEIVSNSFLSGWNSSLCAGVDCFTFIPEFGSLGEIQPGEDVFFSFGMNFGANAGVGTLVVNVFDPSDPDSANSFSLTYHVEGSTTGIQNLDTEYQFKVGPNPTFGPLQIENDLPGTYTVSLYSITGEPVFQETGIGAIWTTDVSQQIPGLYIMTITNDAGLLYRERISKL